MVQRFLNGPSVHKQTDSLFVFFLRLNSFHRDGNTNKHAVCFFLMARRTNQERVDETTTQLLDAARAQFRDFTYAQASTANIAKDAKVSRGALYHHFGDKQLLFRAVAVEEARAVADAIDNATAGVKTPRDALIKGIDAYLSAMALPGRTRVLLLDGPAVLGRSAMDGIAEMFGERTLREGLIAATGNWLDEPLVFALAQQIGAAFDRAALAIEGGAAVATQHRALVVLIDGILKGVANP